jgi:hypothetical protein
MYQNGDTANVKGSFFSGERFVQDVTSSRRLSLKVGNEHDKLHSCGNGRTFSDPSGSIVNANLNSTVNGGSNIVGVALGWKKGEGRKRKIE